MSLVSVIVPVYNIEIYLSKCINSILNQSFKDFKLILIDDGSLDNSPIICDEYSKKDNRIIVIHKSNGGASSARNAGLDYVFNHIKSKFIAFIDGDDYVESNYLEELVENIDDCDLSTCSCAMEDDRCNEIWKLELPLNGKIDEKGFWELHFSTENGWSIVPWCKLYKKELFEGLHFKENIYNEDQEIIHRIINRTKAIKIINCCLYHYVRHSESLTSIDNQVAVDNKFEALINRAYYFLSKDLFYKFYVATTYRCLRDYYDYFCRFKNHIPLKKKLKKLIKSGQKQKLSRNIVWYTMIFFPRVSHFILRLIGWNY